MAWTLREIRQRAAREAGKFHVSTVTSATASTVTDTSWPVNSSTAASGRYKDYWLYAPNAAAADKVRRVKTDQGTGGILTLDTNQGTPMSPGDPYELHGMFPPSGNENSSWTTLINDGLKSCLVPVEFSLNPSSNSITRFSLATAIPWLSDPLLVRQAGVLASGSNRQATDPYQVGRITGRCTLDGVTVYLDTYPRTFATTDTIYLMVLTPAYYAIQANGSGPFTQTGMSLETDVAPIDDLELGAYAALVQAWQRESQIMEAATAGRVINSLSQAVDHFNAYTPEWGMRLPLQLKRLRQWGPPTRNSSYTPFWSHG